MFLLDTNVASELRRAGTGRCDPGVEAWAADHAVGGQYLSAITVLELEQGVLLRERRDAAAGAVLREWLDRVVVPAFDDRILPVDAEVARRAAALHVPDARPWRDALIAATAVQAGLTLVTRNVADFTVPGLDVTDPWVSRP